MNNNTVKASDLRLGNIVDYNYKTDKRSVVEWIQQDSIHLRFLEPAIEDLTNGCIVSPEWIIPIPLSTELLEKIGFKKNGDRIWITEQTDFVSIHENGSWSNSKPDGEIKYILYKNYIGAIAEVKYLHELQNITHSLTKIELNINL